jgi:hypothetical protein
MKVGGMVNAIVMVDQNITKSRMACLLSEHCHEVVEHPLHALYTVTFSVV